MRFAEVYDRRQKRRLSTLEAADILGIDERTFRRWCRRYEDEGAEGLADRRIGKAAWHRAPVDEVARMLELFETRYLGWTVKHFHDKLGQTHGIQRSYTWTKNQLQAAGKIAKLKKRGVHRKKRPRRPLPGMMLHQDSSQHQWVPGQWWDLIVTLDDATSEVYSAFFVDEEGTYSSFQGVQEVIEQRGLFSSLYVDRGSHYWHTPEAGGKVDKNNPTEFHRALKQLGIELIAAYSPEARGRSERAFQTFQGRLPQELVLEGITARTAANNYLKTTFVPDYNARFSVKALDTGSAFVPWIGGHQALADILCIQQERTVAKDNTVSYQGKSLQIPQDRHRYHYMKVRVRIHEYQDGSLAVFHGPRCLARYDAQGNLSDFKPADQAALG